MLVGVTDTRGAAELAVPSMVVAAQRGDREAFGEIFERYAAMVHGVLLARVPREEADDLMQDVFVTAMQKIGSLRDANAFGGWLAMIARNRVIDFYRTRRKTTELPEDIVHEHSGEGERSEAEQVLAIIRTLPEAYRETLVLRLVEGMSGPEIAARVGLTPESVRVNLHRGMAMLRERLGEEKAP
jgi:RNA polymerase sigma-70 factor (ECF subfamily)